MIGGVGPEFYSVPTLEKHARNAVHEVRMALAELTRLVGEDDPTRSLQRERTVRHFMEAAMESMYLVLNVAEGLPRDIEDFVELESKKQEGNNAN
ncbi:MAG: hypothetical protein VW683_17685 [Betaproteobacteria bacterium]